LKSINPPDAIFAAADLAELGALEAARSLKIKVPEQLGICGFSNEPYTELTTPAITTIDQNSYGMGEIVANLYFDKIKGIGSKTSTTSKTIQTRLIIRESSTRR
jgi:LacI family transcriptional regulator